jgi:hypothetical protein
MPVLAERHQAVATELCEWWEDLWQRGIGSQIVMLKVPRRWGRSAVLDRLAQTLGSEDAPVTLVLRIDARELPEGLGLQAEILRALLAGAGSQHRVAEPLGLNRLAEGVQPGVGVNGLSGSGFAADMGFLLDGMAAGAAGKVWDETPAGQCGSVARVARSVAAVSTSVPVVVLVDDADCLDTALAVVMLENLAYRVDGQLLAIAAVDPDGGLARALTSGGRYLLFDRVHTVGADPDMSYQARVALTRELRPTLPDTVSQRIARRTRTFADVFAVASAEQLADALSGDDHSGLRALADAVIDAKLTRPAPSEEAMMLVWAGGSVHARQAARGLSVAGARFTADDPDIIRAGSLVRLADPASPRLAASAAALAVEARQAMAAAFLDEAIRIVADPAAPLVDRIVATRATHRVRADLAERDRRRRIRVQRAMVLGLESAGDLAEAAAAAAEALRECPSSEEHRQDREDLATAVLRLAHIAPAGSENALAEELIGEVMAAGAAIGLEARVWAAVNQLNMPDRRDAARTLAEQVAADLDRHHDLGPAAANWRLLLAYHAGHAGHPSIIFSLLAPLLNSGEAHLQDAASTVLEAVGGARADVRLQIAFLEAELQAGPSDGDRIRLHHALASAYEEFGDYRNAVHHANRELPLRVGVQGFGHPHTLTTRHNIAYWTGQCGDVAGALRLFTHLLPDMERVLGASHPNTVTTRYNIAYWTGRCGDGPRALRLFADLVPDMERVLGAGHPDTLTTRNNIAYWTAEHGDGAGALRLFAELLPDMERVLGADHPSTLATRTSLGYWTRELAKDASG